MPPAMQFDPGICLAVDSSRPWHENFDTKSKLVRGSKLRTRARLTDWFEINVMPSRGHLIAVSLRPNPRTGRHPVGRDY